MCGGVAMSVSVGSEEYRRAYKAAKQREYRSLAAAGRLLTAEGIDRLIVEAAASLLADGDPGAAPLLERATAALRNVPDAPRRVADRLLGLERRLVRPSAYRYTGPAIISFSGGLSSAYMTAKSIEAYGGRLPENVHIVFANTGREHEKTLDFVQEFGRRYEHEIVWLEYDPSAKGETRVVTYETASRHGEPFEALITKKRMPPQRKSRFCTERLKILRVQHYARRMLGWRRWTSVVGLRHDEQRRVARQHERAKTRGPGDGIPYLPLDVAGVVRDDVHRFWREQPFTLDLPIVDGHTLAGNCDLCFLKGKRKLLMLMRDHPEWADWWIHQDSRIPSTVRENDACHFHDRWTYAELLTIARPDCAGAAGACNTSVNTETEEDDVNESLDCFCTD